VEICAGWVGCLELCSDSVDYGFLFLCYFSGSFQILSQSLELLAQSDQVSFGVLIDVMIYQELREIDMEREVIWVEMQQEVNKEMHLGLCHCGVRRTRVWSSLKQGDKENYRMRMRPPFSTRKKLLS
jgi:hypothetical protein